MTQFRNVIVFRQVQLEPTQENFNLGMQVAAWLNYTCAAAYRNPQTGDYYAPITVLPPKYRVGKTYHKWLRIGILEHISGFDTANHYIELPISFLEKVHHTEQVTDEEGNMNSVNILNKDVFPQYRINRANTYCIVKITDDNYTELKAHINSDITNIVAEDKFFLTIAEGGDYDIELENSEEDE